MPDASGRIPPVMSHVGLSPLTTYVQKGCRCVDCRKAWRLYQQPRRAKARRAVEQERAALSAGSPFWRLVSILGPAGE